MIRGRSFKLFVISTIMTQRETVIRIEPPRKEAAPSRAYLNFTHSTHKSYQKKKNRKIARLGGGGGGEREETYVPSSMFSFL